MNNILLETAQRIIGQNVLACASTLVFDLNERGDELSYDFYEAPITDDQWLEAAMDHDAPFNFETDMDEVLEYCDDVGAFPESREVYEHWIITDWLATKLEMEHELVIRDFHGLIIWGRTTTGQPMSMDGVIQRIAALTGG